VLNRSTGRASRAEVPVLDLGGLIEGGPIDELARELRHACETIGFWLASREPPECCLTVIGGPAGCLGAPVGPTDGHQISSPVTTGIRVVSAAID
jgi:hypothetical protein